MSAPRTRPTDAPDPPERADDDYSPAFTAWAMLLTTVVLAVLVVVIWALRDL
jgi:hypothetical protein